ncbi:Polysaccharide biosynthesis protein [Carnobacterium divergens]|nr:Polysaccharide biosynthesis protein [Carnobacterium divergens]
MLIKSIHGKINSYQVKKNMNKYKKLLNNSLIFAIGNLGTKLVAILLVPLYTYYLTPSEYGVTDLITTSTNLLLPIVSLSIFDAVLRFVMDQDADKESVLTNGIVVSIIGSVASLLLYPVALNFMKSDLLLPLYILLFLQIFYSIFSQFARGIGRVSLFASSGVIVACFLLFFNLVFIVYLKMSISGYLLSMILSTIIGILYLVIFLKINQYFYWKKINKKLIKMMLLYSIPLIPNSLMWWITNASGRFFILYYLGLSANGLYAVANKFPSLLSILYSIFFQAWQLSAIEEFDSKESGNFFSTIFNFFTFVMFIGSSIFLVFLKPVLSFAVETSYFITWKYIPFLLLGVVFSSFSSFITASYIAAKETKGVFITSIFGALVNIIGNFILIPIFGLTGASISVMISFFVTWIIRMRDTKSLINLNLDKLNICLNIALISVQIGILNLNMNTQYELISNTVVFIFLCFINKEYIKKLLGKILSLKK